jgi:hypothetical protein
LRTKTRLLRLALDNPRAADDELGFITLENIVCGALGAPEISAGHGSHGNFQMVPGAGRRLNVGPFVLEPSMK